MQTAPEKELKERRVGENVWLGYSGGETTLPHDFPEYRYKVLDDEAAVGQAMFDELVNYAAAKSGDIVIVLLGGRGAQAMYRILNEKSRTTEIDELLSRLHVFTQDALAPLAMENGLSFVRDFERLLGDEFFAKIKSFTPMNTATDDVEGELIKYLEKLENLGGIDIFFLGLGPEAEAASHLCYIKPNSGANIPITPELSRFRKAFSNITSTNSKSAAVRFPSRRSRMPPCDAYFNAGSGGDFKRETNRSVNR